VAEAVKIGGFFNSGRDCTASSRILVSSRIYDDVLAQTVKAVESLTVGDPASDHGIGMGPVISGEQQERILGFGCVWINERCSRFAHQDGSLLTHFVGSDM
jgi:acyl-CoA reductase-like NAD-dependent aldehyde dehydrogenase